MRLCVASLGNREVHVQWERGRESETYYKPSAKFILLANFKWQVPQIWDFRVPGFMHDREIAVFRVSEVPWGWISIGVNALRSVAWHFLQWRQFRCLFLFHIPVANANNFGDLSEWIRSASAFARVGVFRGLQCTMFQSECWRLQMKLPISPYRETLHCSAGPQRIVVCLRSRIVLLLLTEIMISALVLAILSSVAFVSNRWVSFSLYVIEMSSFLPLCNDFVPSGTLEFSPGQLLSSWIRNRDCMTASFQI